MKEKAQRILAYFEEKIAVCNQKWETLNADDRADEATFQKVEANVYDIFRTVFSVATRTCGDDPMAVQAFFVKKTEEIPAPWLTALEQARRHGDPKKNCIESIKLDAAREIRENFFRIWGDGQ